VNNHTFSEWAARPHMLRAKLSKHAPAYGHGSDRSIERSCEGRVRRLMLNRGLRHEFEAILS
jgi:hypothetical protein